MLKNILLANCVWLFHTIYTIPGLNYLVAIILSYIIIGILADNFLQSISQNQWERIRDSIKDANKKIKNGNEIPMETFAGEWRHEFSWMTRKIGIIERIFYTSAIIFSHFEFIGFWLAIKAIGEWSDGIHREGPDKVTRIRINNFLIMSGYSLLWSLLAGLLFKAIVNIKLINALIN